MEYSYQERCWIWLSYVRGMTPKRFYRALAEAGDAADIYEQPAEFKSAFEPKVYESLMRARSEEPPDEVADQLEKRGVIAITRMGNAYPPRLEHISDPPPTLFVLGSPCLELDRPLAVVGTRRASYEGRKTALEFCRELALQGASIVSGLARGIDTFSHTACLDAGSRTVAVLGNGLGSIYPPENAELAQRITESGGSLVSELRLDEAPARWTFPARNRLIAGLSDAVLVVEGDRKSGSLITAGYALEEGRDVFAVPGSIYSPLSEGPNSLIQSGAYMALSPWNILETMRWGSRPLSAKAEKTPPALDEKEKKIYDLLKNEAMSFSELEDRGGFQAPELNSCLTMMSLRSIIIKLPGNVYRLA